MDNLIEEISITELEQRVEFSCCGGGGGGGDDCDNSGGGGEGGGNGSGGPFNPNPDPCP